MDYNDIFNSMFNGSTPDDFDPLNKNKLTPEQELGKQLLKLHEQHKPKKHSEVQEV